MRYVERLLGHSRTARIAQPRSIAITRTDGPAMISQAPYPGGLDQEDDAPTVEVFPGASSPMRPVDVLRVYRVHYVRREVEDVLNNILLTSSTTWSETDIAEAVISRLTKTCRDGRDGNS